MEKKDIKKLVLKVSEGVVSTLTDLLLAQLFFGYELSFCSGRSPYDVQMVAERAHEDLAQFNYKQLKKTIYNLKSKGLVKYIKREKILLPQITVAGKRRLKTILPVYDEKRVWDKRVYLITYDISEKRRVDRNILRSYLEKIGCGMLQASVWLTPYNPKEILREFIEEKNLFGQVLISDI